MDTSRQIKFRGKRKDNNEWIYGYLVVTPTGEHRIHWKPFDGANHNTYHVVITESVGQFTELLDEDKNEIYEDDYLDDNKPWLVTKLAGGAWALNYANGAGEKFLYPIMQDLKIIGNKHDHQIEFSKLIKK